jgi:ferredoxin
MERSHLPLVRGPETTASASLRSISRVKLRVDAEMCTGHGRCYALAPDVFGADDYGHCEILVAEVDGELLEQAELGVQNCPEQAISFED